MKKYNLITRVYTLLGVPIILLAVIASVSIAISPLYSEPKVIAILPFENLHKKPHLEFVKNIVHEKLFTQLSSTDTVPGFIVIGVSSLDDAKKLYKISGGKLPTVILQGEYFMIRDRMALNVSLFSPKNGSRIDGTGELVVYKGHRHPELSGQANFQQSLYEDMPEPLNKLIKGIQELLIKL